MDLSRFDRILSRSIALIGLVALAALGLGLQRRQVPSGAVVGFTGLYALGKIVTGMLGLMRGWPMWPAVFAEAAAISAIGVMVRSGSRSTVYLFVCVTLLLAAGLWRSRVARTREDA